MRAPHLRPGEATHFLFQFTEVTHEQPMLHGLHKDGVAVNDPAVIIGTAQICTWRVCPAFVLGMPNLSKRLVFFVVEQVLCFQACYTQAGNRPFASVAQAPREG